jgi:hypothetical protein
MQNLIFKSRNLQKLVIILSAFAFIIIGCGGGGDGGGSPSAASPTVETGTFLDSPVQGLSYETATQSDVTDANGTFKYQTGETIKFFLGDILIGQATAKKTMTPIDLVPGATNEMHQTVTNICRLLQSLDYDSNPDNGIYITQQIRNEIEGRTIDFNMSTAEFGADADVIALFNTLNAMNAFSIRADRTLCTAQQAQNHLRETLGINDGSSDSSGHDESNYS